jgi:hypothetical protein
VRLFDEVFEEAIRGEVADLEVKRREVNGPDVRGSEVRDLEAMDNLTIQEINSSGWLQAVLQTCDILVRIWIHGPVPLTNGSKSQNSRNQAFFVCSDADPKFCDKIPNGH